MKLQTIRLTFIVAAILAGIAAFPSASVPRPAATVSDLRVYCSDGFKPTIEALRPRIERSIGRPISPEFDSSKTLENKIQSGEPFDVAILTAEALDDLIKQGKIASDTRVELGRAGIGVGLREGAPKPDISTPEAMKRALLSAKSIAFTSNGASAVHIDEMADRLGIADAVKPKFIRETGAGQPQRDVAAGKAEMVITLIPEIAGFPGVELVGPLPGNLQSYINFSAGVAQNSSNAAAAEALIKFISAPSSAPALKAHGVDPQ